MRLSEMLTAIREYPALKIKYEAMREQQASQERTAVQLSIAYNNLQIGNRKLSQKNKALEAALVKLVPRLNSREHSRRFYKTVAPYLDPGGFVLYRSAAELTRFHISTEFATEDDMGKFEEMDGYGMLRYLTADRFGSVEYVKEIDGSLASMQAIVGGFIQAVEPFDDPNVLLVCNEEAKLLGLPENRFLRNRNGIPYDIIHGTFFLAQGSGEEFCSLTDKQIQTYTRLYSREKLFVMQHGKVINQPKKGKSTHER